MSDNTVAAKNILVVDDEFMNIRMAERILKDLPSVSFVRAMNSAELFEALENNDISVIMLDLRMPDSNGFDLYAKIRKKYDTPVVIMTADRSDETIHRIEALGMADHLSKPLDPIKTRELISSLLNIG